MSFSTVSDLLNTNLIMLFRFKMPLPVTAEKSWKRDVAAYTKMTKCVDIALSDLVFYFFSKCKAQSFLNFSLIRPKKSWIFPIFFNFNFFLLKAKKSCQMKKCSTLKGIFYKNVVKSWDFVYIFPKKLKKEKFRVWARVGQLPGNIK